MTGGEPTRAGAPGAERDVFDVLIIAVPATGSAAVGSVVHCAVRASDVHAVARLDRVTPYPGAPPDVPGVTAVRGQIVPVLFLASPDVASGPGVLVGTGARALVLAGGGPTRVTAATDATEDSAAPLAAIVLWSGRELPLAGAVRLADASRPDAAGGPPLPLLDAAALIAGAVDDTDGGR